jgi:hypothetical protein
MHTLVGMFLLGSLGWLGLAVLVIFAIAKFIAAGAGDKGNYDL